MQTDRTSTVLRSMIADPSFSAITIEALLAKLGRRGFGGVLLLLAVVGLLPGISFLSGFAVIVLGYQLLLGFPAPRLPAALMRRELSGDTFASAGEYTAARVEWLERWVRPRWPRATVPPALNAIGVVVLLLGAVFILPLPFTNISASIALVVLSVSLIERDGLSLATGVVLSMISIAVGWFFLGYAIDGVASYIQSRMAVSGPAAT